MTQNTASQMLPPEDEVTDQQNQAQDDLKAIQRGTPDASKAISIKPVYPNWPTSKPGPHSTPPPPGMRAMSAMRPEQMKELDYNQETGEPSTQSPLRSLPDAAITGETSFDQPTAQESLKKRKERL